MNIDTNHGYLDSRMELTGRKSQKSDPFFIFPNTKLT